MNSTNKQHS